jgi:aminoglycoside/choline kinase family phosphotransferase
VERTQAAQTWAAQALGAASVNITPASADASFRRYFRVRANAGTDVAPAHQGRDYIVMDAPPAVEDCRPFIAVARLFKDAGVNVPEVLADDLDQGFLLLTDLGDTTYLRALADAGFDPARARPLYLAANDALIAIQRASRADALPAYDRALLTRELQLFPEWYIGKHLGQTLTGAQQRVLDSVFERLTANALGQPQVYVHRDWHSRNLMVCEPLPGVLDFQDAVYGPITYDLVSLYRDAYVEWDEEHQLDWVIRYWEKARAADLPVNSDFGEFWRDYEWMGAQRQLKVLGIFARLYHRDGKDGYLKDMPRVMGYLRKTCERYDELKQLLFLLDAFDNREIQVGYTF